MPIKSYRDLHVWQAAVDLVVEVYRLIQQFPKQELFGLVSQMQRAAVSVPSNIAEGHGRNSGNEFGRFLTIALGSLAELETQLIIAKKLQYVGQESGATLLAKMDEIGRMLRGLLKSLKRP